MRRFLALALLVLLWRPIHASDGDIRTILADLAEITGWKATRTIRQESMDRDALRRYLEKRMREAVKPKELRAEELTIKKLGFVPQDFDLKKTTIDLLTEQAAAFYDYRKKKLFLLSWSPSAMERPLLVHELAHALADQHVHLERFIKRESNDDGAIARMAVMEGQASWLMAEHLARQSGQSLKTAPAMLEMMARADTSAEQFPVLAKAPLYIQESLLFPYTAGIRFQNALYQELGRAAFAEVFRKPPLSSQQIIHPDLYRKGLKPTSPRLPELVSTRGYRVLAEGSIGELDHSILLRQYASQDAAGRVAPSWRGGAYRLMEHKAGPIALLYVSEWADAETAAEFFRLYQQVLRKKWQRVEIALEANDRFAGKSEDGYFLVRWQGVSVTSVEGMRSPSEAR
ncbi:MAG: hypothetical protein Q8N47_19925 [Bryobacterales bacterium]|nr:hypothetical protein [Bryobacterales bacterium]